MASSAPSTFARLRPEDIPDAIAELIDQARECASRIAWIQAALDRLIEVTPAHGREPIAGILELVRRLGQMVPLVGDRLRKAHSDAANIVRLNRRLEGVPILGRVFFAPKVLGVLASKCRALLKTRQVSQRQVEMIELMRRSASTTVSLVPAPLWIDCSKGCRILSKRCF